MSERTVGRILAYLEQRGRVERVARKETYAREVRSGKGASLRGGRWNPKGPPAVYASEHLALAVLGTCSFVFRCRRALSSEAPHLPADWRALPHPFSTQEVGRAFFQEKRALALRVPSVLVPEGWNLVLNPEHPALAQVGIEGPFPLVVDPRIHTIWQRVPTPAHP